MQINRCKVINNLSTIEKISTLHKIVVLKKAVPCKNWYLAKIGTMQCKLGCQKTPLMLNIRNSPYIEHTDLKTDHSPYIKQFPLY